MVGETKSHLITDNGVRWNGWARIILWGAIVAALCIPWLANFPWTLSDFVFAGALLGTAGLALEMGARISRGSLAYFAGTCVAVAASVGLVLANGAVGIIGSGDNAATLPYYAVPLVAVIGSAVARFSAWGIARAMSVTAFAQVLAGVISLSIDGSSRETQALLEVGVGTVLFGSLWLFAAALFRKAARGRQARNEGKP